MPPCPFCDLDPSKPVASSPHALAIRDSYPLTEGHTLVLPRKHVASVFDLPAAELDDLWRLVARVRSDLKAELGVDAFNVGVNDGRAAGQTLEHAHVHVIPRRDGDSDDPRGGVRWVIPERAPYWK